MKTAPIEFSDCLVEADPSGSLWLPDHATLIFSDLHLEKGSSFARHGSLLPPYDTRATLLRMAEVIGRHTPRRVVALGDSFHDAQAWQRLDPDDAEMLQGLVGGQEWLWLAGNHDPLPPLGLGGAVCRDGLTIGPLTLCHEASDSSENRMQISGHFHPKASIRVHGRRVSRRCFIADARRLIMPAFGAYAGGLDILHPAICRLFPEAFTAYLLGSARVLPVASSWFAGSIESRRDLVKPIWKRVTA